MSSLYLLFDGFPPVEQAVPPEEGGPVEEWSKKRRRGMRKYICGSCGFQYWEDQVVVQNGLVRCEGPETNNCVDQPGYRAAKRRLELPLEKPNPPLRVRDEDL